MAFFEGSNYGIDSDWFRDIQLNFAGYPGEIAQVKWQLNSNHDSVCVSTDRTAGRSRTMAFQVFPPLAEA